MRGSGPDFSTMLGAFLPLATAVVCGWAIVIARLVTNRFVRRHHEEAIKRAMEAMKSDGMDPFFEAVADAATVPPWGQVPFACSALYTLGFLGLIASGVWSFFSIGWWATAVVASLYLLTGLVPSALKGKRWRSLK
jgi:hypothetical protein